MLICVSRSALLEGESATVVTPMRLCSLQASEKLWPDVFSREEVKQKRQKVIQQMEVVRPVVETG